MKASRLAEIKALYESKPDDCVKFIPELIDAVYIWFSEACVLRSKTDHCLKDIQADLQEIIKILNRMAQK